MMGGWFDSPGAWWLAGAALLALAELAIPGVFLLFFAIAAAITGALALLFPDLGLAGQLVSFAVWSAAAVLIGKRWYRDFPVESTDPLLNDRVARLVGETVTVVQAIDGGTGRVRVGDGEWTVYGPDAPVGARMRVIGGDRGALKVEPIDALPRP
jgi:membrane protein implicated in regulation of membrane protease activity